MMTKPQAEIALRPKRGANVLRMRRAPTHPGEMFEEEWRIPSAVSQAEAARRMGMSANRLNEIVVGKRGVTAQTAVLLGALTRTNPQLWLYLQADYDIWHALQTIETRRIRPLDAKGDR